MADINDPVDINVTPDQFLEDNALYLVDKKDLQPKAKIDIEYHHTKWWSNKVDNVLIELQKQATSTPANAIGRGLIPDDPAAAAENSVILQELLDQGAFFIPAGLYYTAVSHTYNSTSRFVGAGSNVVTFRHSGNGAFLQPPSSVPSPDSEDRVYNAFFGGFTVFGPGSDVAGSIGLDHSQTSKSNVIDVEIWDFETSIKKSGWAVYCNFIAVHCQNAVNGLVADYGANHNLMMGCKFGGMDNAFVIRQNPDLDPADGTNDWEFIHCASEGITLCHYWLDALTPQGIRGINIREARCEGANTSKAVVATEHVDQLFFKIYYANLAAGLNDIQCPHGAWREERASGFSSLSTFDDTNMEQVVHMLYRSSDERLHFCKSSNLTNYVTTVGANHFCVGVGSRMEAAEINVARGSTLTAANFTLGPKFGDTASVIMIGNPKKSAGTIRVTPNGAGILINPTLVFTFPNAFSSKPVFIINFNPDDSFGKGVSADVNAMTLQINGYTPVAGTPIDITWHAMGSG